MSSFATLAAGRSPTYDDLALGLAAELGWAEGRARERLRAFARDLPAPDRDLPMAELEAVRRPASTEATGR
jgi:hypothetical protein